MRSLINCWWLPGSCSGGTYLEARAVKRREHRPKEVRQWVLPKVAAHARHTQPLRPRRLPSLRPPDRRCPWRGWAEAGGDLQGLGWRVGQRQHEPLSAGGLQGVTQAGRRKS